MKRRAVLVILVLSVVVNVLLIGTALYLAAPRGGLAFLLGKAGVVENRHSATFWARDRAEVFGLIKPAPGGVVFLGDSITAGFPWAEAFPGVDTYNRGLDGNTTRDVLRRLDTIIAARPAKLFLMIGINDLTHGDAPEAVAERIERIVARVEVGSPSTRIYLQSVLPPAAPPPEAQRELARRVARLNDALRTLAAPPGVEYVDLHANVADGEGFLRAELARDHLHINARGYAVWLERVTPRVRE